MIALYFFFIWINCIHPFILRNKNHFLSSASTTKLSLELRPCPTRAAGLQFYDHPSVDRDEAMKRAHRDISPSYHLTGVIPWDPDTRCAGDILNVME